MLAEIIVDGESEWDTWLLDPRRFTQYADGTYASAKAVEEYQREFIFHRPEEHRPAGRQAKCTSLSDLLASKGAEFGSVNGWERVLYFHPADDDFEHVPSFQFSTFHDQIGVEARAVRDNVSITNLSNTHNALMVAGPRAREVLGSATDHALDNRSFPWLSTREITIANTTVQALRVSFTGELGWELHFPTERSVDIYEALAAAGEPLGMTNFGLLATESMRIEKNYREWKHELHTEFTVSEAQLDRFVDLSKDFRGRAAIVARREAGDRRLLVSLEVTDDEAAAHAGDPIWAAEELIGVVTSGGYGHIVNTNIAMGYVDPVHAAPGSELAIDVIGVRSRAVVRAEPMYDPDHKRPRAELETK